MTVQSTSPGTIRPLTEGEVATLYKLADEGSCPLSGDCGGAPEICTCSTILMLCDEWTALRTGGAAQPRPDPFMDDYKRDTLRGVREVTIEECAKIADRSLVGHTLTPGGLARQDEAESIAAAIRALSAVTPSPVAGEEIKRALVTAKCTSPDGTFVHAAMDDVLRALSLPSTEGK